MSRWIFILRRQPPLAPPWKGGDKARAFSPVKCLAQAVFMGGRNFSTSGKKGKHIQLIISQLKKKNPFSSLKKEELEVVVGHKL